MQYLNYTKNPNIYLKNVIFFDNKANFLDIKGKIFNVSLNSIQFVNNINGSFAKI
jgi:hypothetical protein